MLSKPWDVQWRTLQYSEQNADLISTDADELDGKPLIEGVPSKFSLGSVDFSLNNYCDFELGHYTSSFVPNSP